jgi:hypothetical protein
MPQSPYYFDGVDKGRDAPEVCITATRNIGKADVAIISEAMKELVADPKVTTIYFGGARGGDTEALLAAYNHRIALERGLRPQLVLVVPDTLKAQPRETWEISELADEKIELSQPITSSDGFAAYRKRNQYMVDRAGRVTAFWNEDKRSGTWMAITMAAAQKKAVRVFPVAGRKR